MKKITSFIFSSLFLILGVCIFCGNIVNAGEVERHEITVKSRQIIDFPINTLSEDVQNIYVRNG